MLKNYIKIALRTLRRDKGNAVINSVGLAVGLACSLVIFLLVRYEVAYDQFHEKTDRIYRVTYEEINTPAQRHLATVSPPVAPALVETYPEIVNAVRLRTSDRQMFARGSVRFYESDFFYVDSSFFDVFSFPLAQGNPETALAVASSVVLTQETARKYFGDEDPMGQVITMNDDVDLVVTGLLAASPSHSHLDFDFLVSFPTFRVPLGYPVTLESWGWISFHTYVLLTDGAEATVLEAKLPDFMRTHFDERRATTVRLRLQPVSDIYLGEPKHPEMASGSVAYIYGLSGIAVLILLLACFNFANLSTARSIRRSTEVSVRKVLGAQKHHLIKQFLGESVLVALCSLGLALFFVEGFIAGLYRLTGWEVSMQATDYQVMLPLFLALTLLIGVIAGSYPALVLSRFQPIAVLKGGQAQGQGGSTFRRVLVTLQFAIAIALIAGSIIVTRQMDFIRTKELGFDQEAVLALHMDGLDLLGRYPTLKASFLQNPHVLNVTKGGDMFDGDQGSVPIFPEGGNDDETRAMNIYSLYFDFVETLGLDVIRGRSPSEAFPTDSARAVMLNRTAADIFAATVPGWDDPIGKQIRVGDIMEGQVVGVVEDFHFASLHSEIAPLVLYIPRTAIDKVFVRLRPGNIPDVLASLEQDWQRVVPDYPFTFTFLDDYIQQLYQADQQFSQLVSVFSLLTILVACLGLYGLASFITQLRTKEIGIRKVLGASVPGLVMMIAKPFLLYVLLANLIAWPMAYFGMQQWLQDFAYRIDLSWGIFLVAGSLAFVIAMLTVSYQSIKASLADPVESLRYE